MRLLTPILAAFALLMVLSCSGSPPEPLPAAEEVRLKEELHDRSFRQFDPSKDADIRKAVILEFFDGITLWAQYAEGDYAEKEWEISSKDYRILKSGASDYELVFVDPGTRQQIPVECEDCVEVSGVTVSVKGLEGEEASFKINDPESILPLPFPVFNSWTKFQEDEYFECEERRLQAK